MAGGEVSVMARAVRFGATLPQIKRSWEESRAAVLGKQIATLDHISGGHAAPCFEAEHFSVREVICEPRPEFFGRDTREPARHFAATVIPAFRTVAGSDVHPV
jgi:hypothetical protein